ncbi:hypothetical protein SLS64_013149 [Diaporthe eres]|uniref:HypA n=1 Tax=Diaporthe eres TaxID=83184 RepID=A0ABR1P1K0_DIAER
MSTQTMTTSSQVRLGPQHLGMCPGIKSAAPGTIDTANRLLQKNHDESHIFWRDFAGHNHTVHNVLTRLAIGANSADLESGYVDNNRDRRPMPPLDENVIRELESDDGFYRHLGQLPDYTNYMVFFEREIERKGWKEVIQEYCFARTRNADVLLARMFDGAFHPIIHLGLGVEFEQPSIVAEALAQAATDISFDVDVFFLNAEKFAREAGPPPAEPRPLVELYDEAYSDETIRTAARWEDFQWKMKNGVIGRAGQEIAALAAQFRVEPATLERRTAEMISCSAYLAGAAQRPGKERRIDFFYMHDVTSSIFLTILARQPWIRLEDRIRMVEWKTRLDLVWYATCGTPKLHLSELEGYKAGPSAGWSWEKMFDVLRGLHDDGHVAKFARALKNGEEVSQQFESGQSLSAFPVKGDMWLNLARMAYDITLGVPEEKKWLPFVGFDVQWENVPNLQD